MCVICEKIYPEIPRQEQPSITLPPISLPSIQQSLPSFGQTTSKDLIERAYQGLATELVRLTESLSRYDTGSKDYDDYLTRVKQVVETMHIMKK
jgi:hypothetical protein